MLLFGALGERGGNKRERQEGDTGGRLKNVCGPLEEDIVVQRMLPPIIAVDNTSLGDRFYTHTSIHINSILIKIPVTILSS